MAFGYFENFILKFAKKHYGGEAKFKLNIVIPQNITDIDAQIAKYKHENPCCQTTGDRPLAFKLMAMNPTIGIFQRLLQTINNLIDYFIPAVEFELVSRKRSGGFNMNCETLKGH